MAKLTRPESENAMLSPVLTLFKGDAFSCFEQVPLGRKRIDLVAVEKATDLLISIELKISDWKSALWQASINFQLSEKSYIAIWHQFVPRAMKNIDTIERYGVGIISVWPDRAEILVESNDSVSRIRPSKKPEWYELLLLTHESSP